MISKTLFDFEKFTYEVLSTQLERKGLRGLFSREKYDTVYYIRKVSKSYGDIFEDEFLVTFFGEYRFISDYLIGELYGNKIVYWNNSQEPANLITRMKAEDSDSFVVFSSDDIP